MPGRSQGRGYALTESSVPALNVQLPALSCGNAVRGQGDAFNEGGGDSVCWSLASAWPASALGAPMSILDACPLCGEPPCEPVYLDGGLACRGCASACGVCGDACLPGEDVCAECARHIHHQCEAVAL